MRVRYQTAPHPDFSNIKQDPKTKNFVFPYLINSIVIKYVIVNIKY